MFGANSIIRRRLINETKLELEADAVLEGTQTLGTGRSMTAAMSVLHRAVDRPISLDPSNSVKKYYASGEERGAVLDFVDYPLNNRWWLEDEFAKIRALGSEAERSRRLIEIARWEHPGPGSFYDNVGNESKSPHVVRGDFEAGPHPTFSWWDEGFSRARLSWQASMWPLSLVYEGLDPNATYIVRSSGYGQALPRINGERVNPTRWTEGKWAISKSSRWRRNTYGSGS